MTPVLQGPASPPLRPIPTFLGVPIGDLEDLRHGDVAMAGLFLDHGDQMRFGKRFAARQLRYASVLERLRPPAGPRGRCLDLGELNVFPLEPKRQEVALRRQIGAIAETGAVPVIVGGRGLPFPLGDCVPDVASTVPLPGAPPSGRGRMALVVDLASIFDRLADPRAGSKLFAALGAIPAPRIAAVHLTGFAPDPDVDGRREASLAAHTLALIAAQLVTGAPCP